LKQNTNDDVVKFLLQKITQS